MRIEIPFEMRFIDLAYQDAIFRESLHMPTASVVIDKGGRAKIELESASAFSVTLDRYNILSGFSVTVGQAEGWNPRTMPDLLEPYIGNKVEIYYGREDLGYNLKVFTGLLNSVSESYSIGSSSNIKLSGDNMARKLQLTDGSYATSTFTGPSKTLLEYWCEQADIEYALTYTDTLYLTSVDINYGTALAGLNEVKEALGPGVEAYFDAYGKLIMRDVQSSSPEFYYESEHILSLVISDNADDIKTKVEVSGDDDSIYAERTADSSILEKFGTVTNAFSSGLIQTQAQANIVADDLLDQGVNQKNKISLSTLLNPYVTVGSVIRVKDLLRASLSRSSARIEKISHSYQAGSSHTTKIDGYFI
jgi:hypothetical protein